MLPKVSVIILNYNNPDETLKCLDSVLKISYSNLNVIIIDNASTSGYENINNVAKNQTRISLVRNKENLGYGGGNNVGIKFAMKQGSDYIFILNNDTQVPPEILTNLIEEAERDKGIGIIAPAINEGNRTTYGGRIKWLKPELKHISSKSYPSTISQSSSYGTSKLKATSLSDYIPGAAMLVRKEVFEKVGLLPEEYFLYFEDADFSMRAKKAGFKLKVMPEVMIYHNVSSSALKLGSPLILRYHMRNSLLFNERLAPFLYRIFIHCWAIGNFIKQTIKIALGINIEQSRAIREGVIDYYKRRLGKI